MLVSFAAFILFLIGSYHVQARLLSVPERLVDGPLFRGMFVFLPPLVLTIYWIAATAALNQRETRFGAPVSFAFPVEGPIAGVTLSVAGVCLVVFAYGFGAFWFATDDGIWIKPSTTARRVVYPWSAVTQVRLSCGHARYDGNFVKFRLVLADGEIVEVIGSHPTELATYMVRIARLTGPAKLDDATGSRELCPAGLVQLLAARGP